MEAIMIIILGIILFSIVGVIAFILFSVFKGLDDADDRYAAVFGFFHDNKGNWHHIDEVYDPKARKIMTELDKQTDYVYSHRGMKFK